MDALEPFAYPIALIVIAFLFLVIFYRPITRLLDRIQSAKVAGQSVEFGKHDRAEQQAKVSPPADTATANVATIAKATSEVVDASHAMPPPNEAYAPLEEQIRNALPKDRSPEVESSSHPPPQRLRRDAIAFFFARSV